MKIHLRMRVSALVAIFTLAVIAGVADAMVSQANGAVGSVPTTSWSTASKSTNRATSHQDSIQRQRQHKAEPPYITQQQPNANTKHTANNIVLFPRVIYHGQGISPRTHFIDADGAAYLKWFCTSVEHFTRRLREQKENASLEKLLFGRVSRHASERPAERAWFYAGVDEHKIYPLSVESWIDEWLPKRRHHRESLRHVTPSMDVCTETSRVVHAIYQLSLEVPLSSRMERRLAFWVAERLPDCRTPTASQAAMIAHGLAKSLKKVDMPEEAFGAWLDIMEISKDGADYGHTSDTPKHTVMWALGVANVLRGMDRPSLLRRHGSKVVMEMEHLLLRIGSPYSVDATSIVPCKAAFAMYRSLTFWDVRRPQKFASEWLQLAHECQSARPAAHSHGIRSGHRRHVPSTLVSKWEMAAANSITRHFRSQGHAVIAHTSQFLYFGYAVDLHFAVSPMEGNGPHHMPINILVDCNGNKYHASREPVKEYILGTSGMPYLKLWWADWRESGQWALPTAFAAEIDAAVDVAGAERNTLALRKGRTLGRVRNAYTT